MLPLLRTKIVIPPTRPRAVARTRLSDRIKEGSGRALTLVVAPAGYGKTTAVAAWARVQADPVAWLSLQAGDRPPERFLAYLVHALQTLSPEIGRSALAVLQMGNADGALHTLINDLAGLDHGMIAVLDDFHLVDGDETGRIIQFLLDHRPANFHLLLVGRTPPNLNLGRLRAQDQLTEIGVEDLRFTCEEERAFLKACMDLDLPAEAMDRLHRSVEGWAAGLQLAGLTLSRHQGDWPAGGEPQAAFDFLAEEVFRREPPEVQTFLAVTGLLDRFCAPLCEAVCARCGAGAGTWRESLAHVERANLFLVELDSGWYRYHALFADFLRRQSPPDQAAAVFRAAADWLERNGLADEAIPYALQARDHDRAAALIETIYRDTLQHGGQTALAEWIAALPAEQLDRRPRLWLAQGWAAVIHFEPARALQCAAKAEAALSTDEEGDSLRGEAKALRVLSGIFAGQAAEPEEISAALGLLSEKDEYLHRLLHFNLGLNYVMRGETGRAVDEFGETLRLTASVDVPLVSIIAQVQLGETRLMRGALGLAERTFQKAIRYVKDSLGENSFLLGMPYISYAELMREQNRLEEAIPLVRQGIAYCQVWLPIASMDGRIALARMQAAQGRWDEAYAALEDALEVAEASESILDDSFVSIFLARLALLGGDAARAGRIINAYEMETTGAGAYYHLREMTQLVLCRAKMAGLQDDPRGASALAEELAGLIAEAEVRERTTSVLEGRILLAYALRDAGLRDEAAESLSRAFAVGAQSGYLRIFADEGAPLLALIDECRAKIHAPAAYLDSLIDILRRETQHPSAAGRRAGAEASGGGMPLTRRELDILALLAVGKTNQEIAAERVLAVNTVKKHVANILNKLDAANRLQAVATARKEGWIA